MSSINLYKNANEASSYIGATITDEGDLQIIRNSFGPGDFETEVTAAVSKQTRSNFSMHFYKRLTPEIKMCWKISQHLPDQKISLCKNSVGPDNSFKEILSNDK